MYALPASVAWRAALRRCRRTARWARGTAELRKWFATVIVGTGCAEDAFSRPPAQKATPVGVPAAYRPHALEETIARWRTAGALTMAPRHGKQAAEDCPEPHQPLHVHFLRRPMNQSRPVPGLGAGNASRAGSACAPAGSTGMVGGTFAQRSLIVRTSQPPPRAR